MYFSLERNHGLIFVHSNIFSMLSPRAKAHASAKTRLHRWESNRQSSRRVIASSATSLMCHRACEMLDVAVSLEALLIGEEFKAWL